MADRLIFQSSVFKIQRCEYTAHACLIKDQEDAKEVMAHISLGYYSAHCAPYAFRLVEETGEVTEASEDLGEFLAGNTLMAVIRSFESIYRPAEASVLVMITRKVLGCFVPEMIQQLKYNAIRTCAHKALSKLNKKLFLPRQLKITPDHEPETVMTGETHTSERKETTKRNPLPTPAIQFNPDSLKIPLVPQRTKAERAAYRPGHFRDKS
jgi:hypothetical protein